MHTPTMAHLNDVYHILRCLKSSPSASLFYSNSLVYLLRAILMQTVLLLIRDLPWVVVPLLEATLLLAGVRYSLLLLIPALRLNFALWLMGFVNFCSYVYFFLSLNFLSHHLCTSIVIIKQLSVLHITQFSMIVLNTLKLTSISLRRNF